MIRCFLIASTLGLTLGMGFAVAGASAQSPAAKAAVDTGKASGAVGEQGDGFLGFVSGSGDPALKAAVAEINAGRARAYQGIAARAASRKAQPAKPPRSSCSASFPPAPSTSPSAAAGRASRSLFRARRLCG